MKFGELWTAEQARKEATRYKSRSMSKILNDVMNRIQSAAASGLFTCIVYTDTLNLGELIDSERTFSIYPLVNTLNQLGYSVVTETNSGLPNDWALKISW